MDKREIYKMVYNHEITADEAMRLLRNKQAKKMSLSENQKTLFISQMLYPDSSAYNLTIPIIINAKVEEAAIKNATEALVHRHPMLRVSIKLNGSDYFKPTQEFGETDDFLYERFDLKNCTLEEQKERVLAISKRKFDILHDKMLRVYLVELGVNRWLVMLVVHHIIADGASLALLARDFVALYKSGTEKSNANIMPVKSSYSKFIEWQQEFLKTPTAKKMEEYWVKNIIVKSEKIDLPRLSGESEKGDFSGKTVIEIIDEELLTDLRDLAHEYNVSLYVLTLAAFYIMLSKYSGQTEIQIGSPMFGRPSAEYFDCVGYFSNIVVLNTEINNDICFSDYIKTIKTSVYEAMDNSVYPLSAVCKRLNCQSPQLFTIAFAVQAFIKDMEMEEDESVFGAQKDEDRVLVDSLQQEGAFELFLEIQEGKSKAKLAFKYQSAVFSENIIKKMASNYVWLLRDIVKNSSRKICDLDCVCADEKRFLLEEVNSNYDEVPSRCIHQYIEDIARATPNKTAVIYKDQVINYLELCNYSTYIANYLKEHGIKKGDVVGVYMDRSVEWILAMIAIFKAGAIYLPLDYKAPIERIKYIIGQTDMKIAFTDAIRGQTECGTYTELVVLEELISKVDFKNNDFLPFENISALDDVAYIIFTSGSTGNPKGVQVWHGGFINSVNTLTNRPGITSGEKVAAIATMCFDMSLVETMPVLYKGGTIEIIPSEIVENGIKLTRYLEQSGITFMSATPATYEILYAAGFKNSSIKKAWVGGEALSSAMAKKMLESFDEVWNIFGPTESSMLVSVHRIIDDKSIEVGTPIGNHCIYVLDEQHHLLPHGAKGELYIGGKGVYKPCYYKDDKNNTEKFIEDKFGEGEFLYKSGDLVSIRNDGVMHFYCRLDGMVKFRGLRIELDEIDSAISKIEGVGTVATVVRSLGENHKEIVSFITVKGEMSKFGADDIKKSIGMWIPKYMIPNTFYILKEIPLLINLKINKKYLTNAHIDEIIDAYSGAVLPDFVDDGELLIDCEICGAEDEIEECVELNENETEYVALEENVSAENEIDYMIGLVIGDLKNILSDILADSDCDTIKNETVLERLGFDSVRYVTFAIKINDLYKIEVNPGSFSNIRTVKQVAVYLINNYLSEVKVLYKDKIAPKKEIKHVEMATTKNKKKSETKKSKVAIVGISYEFSGAQNENEFLHILENGKNKKRSISNREICRELVGRDAYYINNIWDIDADYFNISEGDATIMYPELKKIFSLSAKALSNAGLDPHNIVDTDVAVFLGMGNDDYGSILDELGVARDSDYAKKEYIPVLLSKFYHFSNVSRAVDCSMASSSSLVEAFKAVSTRQCKMALAGGYSILYSAKRIHELECDGRYKSRENQYGVIAGEGGAVFILKTLEDAVKDDDYIYLVIDEIESVMDITGGVYPRQNNMMKLYQAIYGADTNLQKKVAQLEDISIGTKYSKDVLESIHKKYHSDIFNAEQNVTARDLFGDVDVASIYLSLIKVILNNRKNKISSKKYAAITEIGKRGELYHFLVHGYENGNIVEKQVGKIFTKNKNYIIEGNVKQRIQRSVPHILGLTKGDLPIDRMMKYWGEAKRNHVPLPIGSTFLNDNLFREHDNNRMAHVLVEVPSTGKKLEVLIKGYGEPLLLMPGFGLTVTQFLPQMMFLGLNCMMICIHPPGVGLSECCENVTFEAVAGYYREVLDVLGITRKVNIMATSWGGVLAQFFAHEFPERCNTLILANTAGNLVVDTHVGLKEMINDDFVGVNAEEALRMFENATSIDEKISYKYEEILASGRGKTLDFLCDIRIPTQIIAGGKDTLVTVETMRMLHQKLADSRFEVIEASGHASNMMCVSEFNAICTKFLKQHGVASMNRFRHINNVKKYIPKDTK